MNRNSIILSTKHVTHARLFNIAVLVSVSVIIYLFSILAARRIFVANELIPYTTLQWSIFALGEMLFILFMMAFVQIGEFWDSKSGKKISEIDPVIPTQIQGNEPTPPAEPEQCATPTITFANGKLHFECETEGAKMYYDVKKNSYSLGGQVEGDVSIDDTTTYTVTCYATADGYGQSETAEEVITINRADVNGDGNVDVFDITTVAEEILAQ